MTTTLVSLGLLLLRVVGGLTIAVHGAQKLFGWFGGSGFTGTVAMQKNLGFKPPLLWAIFVILGELGAGLSVAFGFLTPLGAAGMFGAMFMAIAKVHWKHGFLMTMSKRGFEYPLQLLTTAVVVGLVGSGSYALDTLLGIAFPQAVLFLLLAAAALVVDFIGLAISRTKPAVAPPASTDAPADRVS